ncbi:tumor protein p63-regulated gene 1-like protein [Liolophura sinensis]|uniref:tumor protein p63-regulated gene 1-like protein n=1 Tax=Liolophura sinensis TaxID=3198878 RepID=UPI00315910E7
MAETKEKTTIPVEENIATDMKIDDDRTGDDSAEFTGATLEIGSGSPNPPVPSVAIAGGAAADGSAFDRGRPGSVYGRQSIKSTTSRTSMRPGYVEPVEITKGYFSYKDGSFDNAVENCKSLLKNELDGSLQGAWLLTEIDHWDNEREKILLLTDSSLFIVNYNFINSKILDSKRVMLHLIDTIQVGDLTYPKESVMPDRQHGGVRILWNKGEQPSFGQMWNPWCSSIPWTTFSHHPVLYNPKENETITYNVDDFYESLLQAVSKAFQKKKPGEKVRLIEGPILIENYLGVSSLVFNQSHLGFFRDRNGVSF